jgi:hypothetical protein
MLSVRSLAAVFGRFPLWSTTWFVLWSMALLIALPWYGRLDGILTGRYPLGTAVHDLDVIFRTDQRAALDALNDNGARAAAVLAALAGLFGVFAAGGWLQVILERTHGQSLRRFFFGGARYFWRFLRVWVLVLLLLAGLRWVFYGMPWNEFVLDRLFHVPASDRETLETLHSELLARQIQWAQAGAFALGFALVCAWGVYTRTRLALHDTSSALIAGLASAWTLFAHPFKTLGPLFVLLLSELAVLLAAGVASRWLDESLLTEASVVRILLLHGVAQLALLWRQITRGAHYYAAVHASRAVIPPPPRPDPWKTIGGPGGPQYPVDGGDEYGVAL